MLIVKYFLVFCLFLLRPLHCYNYLLIPGCMSSHINYIASIGNALYTNNHSVTMMVAASFGKENMASRYPNITPLFFNDTEAGTNAADFTSDKMQEVMFELISDSTELENGLAELCRLTNGLFYAANNDKDFMKKLTSIKFDLAIVDDFSFARGNLLFPKILGIPFVTASSNYVPWSLRIPALPSVYPSQLSSFTPRMNFKERLQNTWWTVLSTYEETLCQIEHLVSKYTEYNNWNSLYQQSLLFVIARDPYLDYASLTTPNVIMTGGLTYRSGETKIDSGEIKNFADNAKSGLVVISFGSMITFLPTNIMLQFLEVFKALPNLFFIMRYKRRKIPTGVILPENLLIADWIPQTQLLSHPNTVLFVTHCGNNGQSESIYRGVPMLAFPVFAEQKYNAARAVYKGLAIEMNIVQFETQDLFENINILTRPNSTYKNAAIKYSHILKKLPIHSKELAAYWIEHVTEFGGEHLKSPVYQLTWFQYYMLDILALIILLAVALVTILLLTVTLIIKKIKSLNFLRVLYINEKKDN